jgi:hypothetical protein
MALLYRLLRSDSLSFADADIPERPGVYVIYDGSERPYYVGQSRTCAGASSSTTGAGTARRTSSAASWRG